MDIRAKSWKHLIEILYKIDPNQYGRCRSDYVYRGMANASWHLETSLIRLGGNIDKVEKPLLRSLRKYSKPDWLIDKTIWMDMTIGQHHGLPTRLLDWTSSPQIAAHFATAESEYFNKDGVIWCVNVGKVHELLPPSLRNILDNEYAWLFSLGMLSAISSLEDFTALKKERKKNQATGRETDEETGDFLLFFEPPSLDERIANQAGIMSILPDHALKIDAFLKNHPHVYQRIIIPAKIKKQVRDMLDQSNITERMIMPGLDGLSKWLKRYYETW